MQLKDLAEGFESIRVDCFKNEFQIGINADILQKVVSCYVRFVDMYFVLVYSKGPRAVPHIGHILKWEMLTVYLMMS